MALPTPWSLLSRAQHNTPVLSAIRTSRPRLCRVGLLQVSCQAGVRSTGLFRRFSSFEQGIVVKIIRAVLRWRSIPAGGIPSSDPKHHRQYGSRSFPILTKALDTLRRWGSIHRLRIETGDNALDFRNALLRFECDESFVVGEPSVAGDGWIRLEGKTACCPKIWRPCHGLSLIVMIRHALMADKTGFSRRS